MTIVFRAVRPDELDVLVAIDDAASELYETAGIVVALGPSHPFVVEETLRWARAIERGDAELALDEVGVPLGFTTVSAVDGVAYLDQIAVHPTAMRRGVGSALLRRVTARTSVPLWLTTYDHLPWNRPYYERHGFVPVAEAACGPEIRAILDAQRAVLPVPEARIAMRRG